MIITITASPVQIVKLKVSRKYKWVYSTLDARIMKIQFENVFVCANYVAATPYQFQIEKEIHQEKGCT